MSGRDRHEVLLQGTYAAMPVANADLVGCWYKVSTGVNEGITYFCEEDGGGGYQWTGFPTPAIPIHGDAYHSETYLKAIPVHGDPYHSETYLKAMQNHSGSIHTGTVGGPMPWGFSTPEDMNCPEGAGYWSYWFESIQRSYTTVKFTKCYIRVSTAPTADIVFTVKWNDGTIGTITLSSGATSANTTLVTPQTVTDGGKITLDCPTDAKDAKGLCFCVNLQRVSTVS